LYECLYRPFTKQHIYYNKAFIESPGLWAQLFPLPNVENLVICLEGTGSSKDFGCLITDKIADYSYGGIHTQCFPLYWYEETKQEKTLFDCVAEPESGYYARRDAISDVILERTRKLYGDKTSKEDVFYYIYGFLHNPDYRAAFAADLKKMLPRIPLLDDSTDFWQYVKAGRKLAALHLHYEDYAHEAANVVVEINNAIYDNYEVTKMRFPSKDDKSRIIYNPYITVTNIPAEAYEYVVNGKSAIEWIMERYQITTHKESGIVNDPNDWAREHNKPKYILDLLLSIIAVSVKTVEIVKGLPEVKFNNAGN
jgi:predicted helicase